ncbi:MAG: LamG domain-containing protein, partial [Boseongicola sp.]|nr:LamG domain-containing protein [Boseongicola sp.]
FNKEEGDTISVIGHTTNIEVDYRTIDADGDGVDDDAVSVITVYSQQGNGGGAHDEDYLGYIVVHGDRVEEDDITTDAGALYGVVETIDDIQEAVAPNGETKWIELEDGTMHLGYDTRDVDGDPVGTSPWEYSSNDWLNSGSVDLASSLPDGLEEPGILMVNDGGAFGGGNDPIEVPHTAEQATSSGTWAFNFNADNPGNGQNQALISKDHSGFETGGHLTAYITGNGVLKVRFQSETEEKYLVDWKTKIEADTDYHFAFTFDEDEIALYLDGELIDADTGFEGGMSGNEEDLAIGASTRTRIDENDNLQWHFDGDIEDVMLLDRPLEEVEILLLAEADNDLDALAGLYGEEVAEEPEEETEEEETEEETGEETPEEEETEETPEEEEEEEEEETPEEEPEEEEETPEEEPEEEEEETPEEEPEEEEEEETPEEEPVSGESGFAAVISRLINILLSIFGMGGDDTPPPAPEDIEEELDEITDLLTDMLPERGAPEDEMLPEDDEEDMLEAVM